MLKCLKIAILILGIGACSSSFAATETTTPVETVAAVITEQPATELQTPQIPAVSETKETEIPVQLDVPKKAGSESSLLLRIFGSLAVITVLAIGAFFMIGKYRRSQIGKSTAPEIKILRQHYLGPKKSLAIIRVAGESMLIGMTDHNINMIKSLSLLDEDVPDEIPQSFQTVFQKSDVQTQISGSASVARNEEPEDFSISGIRDFVSTRLKNMRSLD